MIYQFLLENKPPCLSLKKACEVLSVSRSGYFKHLKNRAEQKIKIKEQKKIIDAFNTHEGWYGYRKVLYYLLQKGNSVSENQVRRTLKQHHLKAKQVKSFKPVTTRPGANEKFSERVFQIEKTKVRRINQVWSSAITYLRAVCQWFIYLAVFLDVFSRKVVGWAVSYEL